MDTGLGGTSSKNTTATEDVLDYNDAFPQLKSSVQGDGLRKNNFFSSAYSTNGSSAVGSMANTASSVHTASKAEDDRSRKLSQYGSALTTKIIEIPPEERALDKNDNARRGQNQSSRGSGALQVSQALQKICTKIQKETGTSITFLYKDQTLLVTITGRADQVRIAQVQLLREIQRPTRLTVNIPADFHRYIIGTRGATLKQLEQDTLTTIKVPSQDTHSDGIVIEGAKDNVKLCEEKILQLYRNQSNKGFERLNIPFLYHPWIRHHLLDDLQQKYNVTVNMPPLAKATDEISIRGEREPVEQAKARIMEYFKSLEGKIMTFPLDIPCEQHRFILGKKGAGLKEIFEKTNVYVRIPSQEENLSTIQVIGETSKIGEAITMIYKMASSLTVVQIPAASWMYNAVRGDHNSRLETFKKNHPDVRVNLRDNFITIEGPPEEVEHVRKEVQTTIDDLRKKNIVCIEVEIDPQYYKQLIGKSQSRLHEIQDQTTSEIKFPPTDEGRIVQIMATKENAEKARQLLLERVQKLANETRVDVAIDPQYYPQLIGAKGKNLEEIRAQFHNIQITIPEANGKSNKVTLNGCKEDVEQCTKYLQQKFKDLHLAEINVPKRLYPMLIGKGGASIQRIREKVPEVRLDLPSLGESKESTTLRLSGKKNEVEKAKKILEEHIEQLNTSMENTVEQTITIDSKWHSRFFLNKQKLLNDLQQQFSEVVIRLPKREAASDQVILRGPKDALDQVRKRIEELIDTWENTVTKEMVVPHRHHGYLLAHSGAHIQPIQKEYDVLIKFPPRGNGNKDEQENQVDESQLDIVRISGRSENVDRAMAALEKIIPIETTVDIPAECHGSLVGKSGANVQALNKQYPDVQVTFPRAKSTETAIQLRGPRDQVELVRKELLDSYEKYQADRQARSFEVRLTIKPQYRSLLFGTRGRTINSLRQKHDVKIDVSQNQTPLPATVPTPTSTGNEDDSQQQQQTEHNQPSDQHDDQQAIPEENALVSSENTSTSPLSDVEVTITGYEEKAIACRDEIVQMIKNFEAKITMEIDIDPRVHARIIGAGGHKLQQIMKDFDVEIKFQTNQSEKVHVIGLNEEKIDACIDHLLVLEEDYLQDLPYRPMSSAQNSTEYSLAQLSNIQQQEVPSVNRGNPHDAQSQKNKQQHQHQQQQQQQRQAPFQLKNAPWTNGNENENENYQHQSNRSGHQRNGHENSPKKGQTPAPNRDDLGEYPSFANGVPSKLDDIVTQVQAPTVNSMPVIWGPPKRNH